MKRGSRLTENARSLRQNMAPAEAILWRELRGGRLAGHRFRRQHAIGAYIVDFYCPAAKLVVELDGVSHLTRTDEDEARDAWIRTQGVEILRVVNTHVFDELEAVKEEIYRAVERRLMGIESSRGTAPHPGPLPEAGRGR
jgi:very-short-patch-repair endonuclease